MSDTARAIMSALGRGGVELSPLGGGLSSEAWLIRDGDALEVLRIATYPEDPITYPSEHAIMAALGGADGSVPLPVVGSWDVEDWHGPAFSITTHLAGGPLRPEARAWAAEPIAAFLRTLHALPVGGLGPIVEVDGGLRGTHDDAEAGTIEAWSGAPLWPLGGARLDRHPALGEQRELAASMEHHAPAVRAAILAGPAVLVHADLHEENILQDDRRLGFIDFGVAFVGAPAWEFAALAYFLDWDLADRALGRYLEVPADIDRWQASIALTALSLGARRWEQDRAYELDEDAHNLAFLRAALERT